MNESLIGHLRAAAAILENLPREGSALVIDAGQAQSIARELNAAATALSKNAAPAKQEPAWVNGWPWGGQAA